MNKGVIIGGIVVLALGGAGYYFYKKNKSEQNEATTETKSISFSTANPSSLLDETADEKEAETTDEKEAETTTETANEGVNGIVGIGAFSTSRGKMLSTKYSDERTGLIL